MLHVLDDDLADLRSGTYAWWGIYQLERWLAQRDQRLAEFDRWCAEHGR